MTRNAKRDRIRTGFIKLDSVSSFIPPASNITFLGTLVTGTGNSSTPTLNHTLSSGNNRCAFVYLGCSVSLTVTGITYGGVAMTRLGTGISGSSERMEIYYLLEASLPSTGSKAVVATLSGTGQYTLQAFTTQDTNQSAPSTPATNSGNNTYLSANVTTSVANSWALTNVFSAANTTFTHNTGQVEISDFQNTSFGTMSSTYEEYATASTYTQGSTAGSSNRMLFMAFVITPS